MRVCKKTTVTLGSTACCRYEHDDSTTTDSFLTVSSVEGVLKKYAFTHLSCMDNAPKKPNMTADLEVNWKSSLTIQGFIFFSNNHKERYSPYWELRY